MDTLIVLVSLRSTALLQLLRKVLLEWRYSLLVTPASSRVSLLRSTCSVSNSEEKVGGMQERHLIHVETAGYGSTPTFMPVIAEMKHPKSFTKSLFTSQGFLVVCYISFALVVYK